MSGILGAKAIGLCSDGHVQPAPGVVFHVQGSAPEPYTVVLSGAASVCTCPATGHCSHIAAARLYARADDASRAVMDERAAARAAA